MNTVKDMTVEDLYDSFADRIAKMAITEIDNDIDGRGTHRVPTKHCSIGKREQLQCLHQTNEQTHVLLVLDGRSS
jgi:hypothetical protein